MPNIESVVKKHLCCSCGLCRNYCKKDAITYRVNKHGFYEPKVDSEKCNNCGLCYNSCPGINDLKNYEQSTEYYCYGYSLDKEMRMNAASGGIATELLCYLIENKIVDYVTCVTNRTSEHLPEQIITNDVKIIRQMRQSKYCPVQWNNIIEQIDKINGSIAVVALPCQINSLKKHYSKRKHNIKFFISLLCNHTPSLYAADYLANAVKKNSTLKSIMNRGNGWPGYMKLILTEEFDSSERKIYFPYRRIWAAGYGMYFKNIRCMACNDPFAKNADITLGDSYFLEDTDKQGTTFCIVRNSELINILNDMKQRNVISSETGPDNDIIAKYYKVLFDREKNYHKINSILHFFKCGISDNEKHKPSVKEILGFLPTVFVGSLGKYRFMWSLLAKRNKIKSLIVNDITENYCGNRL